MNKVAITLAGVLAIASGSALAAQSCDANKPETTPTSRFKDNGDGTVTDTKTRLTWRHCVLGMAWNGKSCEGTSATYDYAGAQDAIAEMNAAKEGHRANWRLPTADELATLVESRCFKPAINLNVFPYSPESGFWSSTENEGVVSERAVVIHFINGGRYIANKNQSWRVRPVAGK